MTDQIDDKDDDVRSEGEVVMEYDMTLEEQGPGTALVRFSEDQPPPDAAQERLLDAMADSVGSIVPMYVSTLDIYARLAAALRDSGGLVLDRATARETIIDTLMRGWNITGPPHIYNALCKNTERQADAVLAALTEAEAQR